MHQGSEYIILLFSLCIKLSSSLKDAPMKDGKPQEQKLDSGQVIIRKSMSQSQALSYCENRTGSGRLAVLSTADSAKSLVEAIKKASNPWTNDEDEAQFTYEFHMSRRYWIGLIDLIKEGDWVWQKDGTPLSYDDLWYNGQPDHILHPDKSKNEHCVTLWNPIFYEGGSHSFNDENCENKHYFICDNGAAGKSDSSQGTKREAKEKKSKLWNSDEERHSMEMFETGNKKETAELGRSLGNGFEVPSNDNKKEVNSHQEPYKKENMSMRKDKGKFEEDDNNDIEPLNKPVDFQRGNNSEENDAQESTRNLADNNQRGSKSSTGSKKNLVKQNKSVPRKAKSEAGQGQALKNKNTTEKPSRTNVVSEGKQASSRSASKNQSQNVTPSKVISSGHEKNDILQQKLGKNATQKNSSEISISSKDKHNSRATRNEVETNSPPKKAISSTTTAKPTIPAYTKTTSKSFLLAEKSLSAIDSKVLKSKQGINNTNNQKIDAVINYIENQIHKMKEQNDSSKLQAISEGSKGQSSTTMNLGEIKSSTKNQYALLSSVPLMPSKAPLKNQFSTSIKANNFTLAKQPGSGKSSNSKQKPHEANKATINKKSKNLVTINIKRNEAKTGQTSTSGSIQASPTEKSEPGGIIPKLVEEFKEAKSNLIENQKLMKGNSNTNSGSENLENNKRNTRTTEDKQNDTAGNGNIKHMTSEKHEDSTTGQNASSSNQENSSDEIRNEVDAGSPPQNDQSQDSSQTNKDEDLIATSTQTQSESTPSVTSGQNENSHRIRRSVFSGTLVANENLLFNQDII